MTLPNYRFEIGLILSHALALTGLRASHQMHIPLLVGAWTLLCLFLLVIDILSSELDLSRSVHISTGLLASVLIGSCLTAILTAIFNDSIFHWTDLHMRVIPAWGGFPNWILSCVLYAFANFLGRFFSHHHPSRQWIFRTVPLAITTLFIYRKEFIFY